MARSTPEDLERYRDTVGLVYRAEQREGGWSMTVIADARRRAVELAKAAEEVLHAL
jgi:hypothetical protein